ADLRDVPAAPRPRHAGYRGRPRDRQAHRGAPRRHDPGGAGAGRRERLQLHDRRGEEGDVSSRTETHRRGSAQLVQILLVEDSSADVELTRQALSEAKVANTV